MSYKWIGAIFILTGCGGFGLSMVCQQRHQEKLLGQFLEVVNFMAWELSYHLTPLPELCRQAAGEVGGSLRGVLLSLCRELDTKASPEVSGCMKKALADHRELTGPVRRLLFQLGRTLGRFDLPGQLQGLEALAASCRREQQKQQKNREDKLRSCQTLCLCAGAALVILFM